MAAQWSKSRNVVERVFVDVKLTLNTPAHFGNGDSNTLTDIPLLRDNVNGNPLLTGASIAGALRNYLREYKSGYGRAEAKDGKSLAEKLFGYLHESDETSYESWLFVDDALGTSSNSHPAIELRDGTSIDPATQTARKGHKYDIELLSAGTSFDLSFELWLTKENRDDLLQGLALVIQGLKNGFIRLGMRKRRGYGKCTAEIIRVSRYDMSHPVDVLAWLDDKPIFGTLPDVTEKTEKESFVVDASFHLDKSSLLIRSGSGSSDSPDMVHLRSWRHGELKPILSGTSLAGVLRGRALKIANTQMASAKKAVEFVDLLFGKHIESATTNPSGSLLIVDETEMDLKQSVGDRVQNRVKLDRFTGGSYPQALFSQQPLHGREDGSTQITIRLELQKTPRNETKFDAQAGLLLFLLKDLWTSDLPLGGESGVGRGRLSGNFAKLTLGDTYWEIKLKGDQLAFGGNGKQSDLEDRFGKAFQEACNG